MKFGVHSISAKKISTLEFHGHFLRVPTHSVPHVCVCHVGRAWCTLASSLTAVTLVERPVFLLAVAIAVVDVLTLRTGLQGMLWSLLLVAGFAKVRKIAFPNLHGSVEAEASEDPRGAVVFVARECFL